MNVRMMRRTDIAIRVDGVKRNKHVGVHGV